MAKIVALTQLSPTMSEGTLSKWRKNEGEKVGPGDVLAEVETDKANMDLESFDRGVLLKQLIAEGTSVKVGAPIAIVGEAGEDITKVLSETKSAASAAAHAPPTPAPQEAKKPAPREAPAAAPPKPAPKEAPREAPGRKDGERILASPLARAIAREKGVDISGIQGSGPSGRIIKRDVETLAPAAGGPDHVDVVPSPMRKTIARRLVESKQKAPHFYLTVECDAAPLKAFRAQANDGVDEKDKVSLNDVIVKCVARALRATPQANASWIEENGAPVFRRWRGVHVGIAVALEDGLLTPVVRNADEKTLSKIAAETKDLIARARQKKLKTEEYSGSTISVSNLGMFGIEEFTAVLNPPEATILAVGGIVEKPVVSKGAIVPGERMRITLSCDHRVVDGALGAQLLSRIKDMIEHPLKAVI
jgi:pyruvate dehydrogenase E2 component (dihydrolipoamide acetyltransferase)